MKLEANTTSLFEQNEEGGLSFFTEDLSLSETTTTIVYELTLADYP